MSTAPNRRGMWGLVHGIRAVVVAMGAGTAVLLDEAQQVPMWLALALVVVATAWIDRRRSIPALWAVDLGVVMVVRAVVDHRHGTEPLFALIGVAIAAGVLGRWRGIAATMVAGAASLAVAVPDAWDHPLRQLASSVTVFGLLAGAGCIIGVIEDRSREAGRRATERNDQLQAVLSAVLRSDPRGIVVRDATDRVVELNAAARAMFGLDGDVDSDWPGSGGLRDGLIDPDGHPVPAEQHPAAVARRTGEVAAERVLGPGGNPPRWFAISAIPVDTPEGRWVVTHVRDATHETSTFARLQEEVTLDPLTGAGNRRLLEWTVDDLIDPDEQVGVAVVDLDDFKAVNDANGHVVGDQVLRQIAERLQALCRPDDVAIRLGGDEFVLVVRRLEDDTAARTVVDRLRGALRAPFPTDAGLLTVSCSVGWTTGTAVEVRALVREADERMYSAKREETDGSEIDLVPIDLAGSADTTPDV